ncbi:hypothetical protein [Streptomyces chattanoogensis]|uniref:Uncharacterized protein n=1 Tax=Streptomyces chattanoogensis TaxID=66876 RepID=A0A0N0GZM4_9ACTN|nr:hypothetical protein [Streptomyces chattanoogensis]KPC62881.1 hypothetical protein ADL29_16810 [Streptomyces chattanoogensis]
MAHIIGSALVRTLIRVLALLVPPTGLRRKDIEAPNAQVARPRRRTAQAPPVPTRHPDLHLPLLNDTSPLARPYLPAYERQMAHPDLVAVGV